MTIETAPVRPSGTRRAWLVSLAVALTLGLALYGRLSLGPPTSQTAGTPAAHAAVSSPFPQRGQVESTLPADLPQPILASAPVGSWPVDMAFGFGGVWVVAVGDGSLSSLDLRTGQFKRALALGGGPIAVAVGDDAVWVAEREAHAIARIDPLFDVHLGTIALSGAPVGVAAGAGALWVASEEDAVLRIDPVTNRIVATILVPAGPRNLVVAFGSVWVASRKAGTVSRIDPTSNEVVATVNLPGADRIAAGPDALWVVNALSCGLGICGRNGQLYRLDPSTGSLTEGASEVGLVAPGADGPWAVDVGPNRLLRLDPETGLATGGSALGLALLPTSLLETPGALWLADGAEGRVVKVALAGGQ